MKNRAIIFLTLFLACSCSYYPEVSIDESNYEILETLKYIRMGDPFKATQAIIMYPGGLVDPWAYGEILETQINHGHMVFISKMPSNLAVLDINLAKGIVETYQKIDKWTLIGHSLGGAMACSEVAKRPELYSNLILLASYPAKNVDLTKYRGGVLSIYGSEDGFISSEDIENSKPQFRNPMDLENTADLIPNSDKTYFFQIEGGNHSFFGSYGLQKGDGVANIAREDQYKITNELIDGLLK